MGGPVLMSRGTQGCNGAACCHDQKAMIKKTQLTDELYAIAGLDFPAAHQALADQAQAMVDAELEMKPLWAELFLESPGKNLDERKSWVETQDSYKEVKARYEYAKKRYDLIKSSIESARTLVSYQKKVLEQLG